MHSFSALECNVGSGRTYMMVEEQGLIEHKQMHCGMSVLHLLLNTLIMEK